MTPKVVVVGSANTDFIVNVPQLPGSGETVLGNHFQVARGGKGANQAVAAARLGGNVTFIARLGDDNLGHEALSAFQDEGICTDYVKLDGSAPSGVALIMVNQKGENIIAVAPGANSHLSPQDVLSAERIIQDADCLLLQLEIPLETVKTAAGLAHRHNVRVILNPAPAQHLPFEFYNRINILTPNEAEVDLLAGGEAKQEDEDNLLRLLELTGVNALIVTLGARGSNIITDGKITHIPAFQVTPVDTTAAGDAFNGALAVALGRGESLPQAARYANAAGALAATKAGAQPSLPTDQDLDQFIRSPLSNEMAGEGHPPGNRKEN